MLSDNPFFLTPEAARSKEWLVTNGLGGYSSSTAIGMNTRKYHGLLIAPLEGAHSRYVMLSKLEETVEIDGMKYGLSTNAYPGAIFPDGYRHLSGFASQPHPTFSYLLGGCTIEKSVRMVREKNTTLVSYRHSGGKDVVISIRAMLSPRSIHSDPLTRQSKNLAENFEPDRFGFTLSKPAKMRLGCSHGKFTASPEHYYDMLYETEKERGYAFSETLFSPGTFTATLSRGDELHLSASLESLSPSEALDILDSQALRFSHIARVYSETSGAERTDFSDALLRAADSFIIRSGKRHGIIAGYHWFSEWSRDSMIALPGLLLSTGRFSLAQEMLERYSSMMKGGLLPNTIDEQGKASYSSSDAALWFVNAVREYADATGDYRFIQATLYKPLRSFLQETVRGNPLIGMDSDCLLRVNDAASTWMDAKVDSVAVVQRKGKPVEINALWHSGLHFIHGLAIRFGDKKTADLCSQAISGSAESFQKFLSHDGSLFDVLEPNDSTLRPNSLFAISLPNSALNHVQQMHAFNIIRSRLYTPLGIRTLSPEDQHYCPHYFGSERSRDSAYHQGMVWPWLQGAFFDAQLRVNPGSEGQVLAALRPFAAALLEGCAGTLPELYEPDGMRPAGAISQAWSVAEILRIYTKVKKAAASPQWQAAPSYQQQPMHAQISFKAREA
jgi:predicted glycogen debranching enzyme